MPLPRRYRHRVEEQSRERIDFYRLGNNRLGLVNLIVRRCAVASQAGKRKQGCALKTPKRIGLGRPIHISERARIAIEVMLCTFVVFDGDLQVLGFRRDYSAP